MRTQLAYYKISFIDKIAQTLKKIKTCISQGDTSNNSSVPRGAHETSRRMAQVSPSPGPASLALPPGQAQSAVQNHASHLALQRRDPAPLWRHRNRALCRQIVNAFFSREGHPEPTHKPNSYSQACLTVRLAGSALVPGARVGDLRRER